MDDTDIIIPKNMNYENTNIQEQKIWLIFTVTEVEPNRLLQWNISSPEKKNCIVLQLHTEFQLFFFQVWHSRCAEMVYIYIYIYIYKI
jgi:hypothetical protein